MFRQRLATALGFDKGPETDAGCHMVIGWFKRSDPLKGAAERLRQKVFEGALAPPLYSGGWAEDTTDGRFVMVALHGSLVLRRLKAVEGTGASLAKRLGELIFDRLDYGLREEGVGDSSIARKIRKLGERFYGLANAMDEAFDTPSSRAVDDVIFRNIADGTRGAGLSSYSVEANQRLSSLSDDALLSGEWTWPSPPDNLETS